MEKFLEEFINSLDKLCYTYENYIWKNKNVRLDVVLENKKINFYLYKNNDIIDEITFGFEDKEEKMYDYVCVKLLIILLGNVKVYNSDNIFYNDTHKSYLKLIVNDNNILNIFKNVVNNQENNIIDENMELVLVMREKIFKRRYYSNLMLQVNNRIELSKKLLRRV